MTNTVVDATQPRLQIGKNEVDHRQVFLCYSMITPFSDGKVVVAAFAETGVAAPIVGNDRRIQLNRFFDKSS